MHGNVRDQFVLRSNDRSHCKRRKADELMTDCKIQEVREFLKKVRKQNEVIRAYESELKDLRIRAVNISSPTLGERVQSNHHASLDEIVEKIESQADKVNEAWSLFMEVRDQAVSLINSEPDEYRRCVLYRYYILCQPWEQIAVEMHFSLRWVMRLHGWALKDLEKEFTKIHVSSIEKGVL